MINGLEELLKSAVQQVFTTMLKVPVQSVPLAPDSLHEQSHIAGTVGFIGQVTGVVYVFSTTSFAREITSKLLSLPEDQIENDAMVNDAFGELTNMIVGRVKSALTDRGMPCVLTIPSIVRGSQFAIEALSTATRRVVCFRCGDRQTIIAELMIKSSEATN